MTAAAYACTLRIRQSSDANIETYFMLARGSAFLSSIEIVILPKEYFFVSSLKSVEKSFGEYFLNQIYLALQKTF